MVRSLRYGRSLYSIMSYLNSILWFVDSYLNSILESRVSYLPLKQYTFLIGNLYSVLSAPPYLILVRRFKCALSVFDVCKSTQHCDISKRYQQKSPLEMLCCFNGQYKSLRTTRYLFHMNTLFIRWFLAKSWVFGRQMSGRTRSNGSTKTRQGSSIWLSTRIVMVVDEKAKAA